MTKYAQMGFTKEGKDPTRAERKIKKRKLAESIFDLPDDLGTQASRDPSISVKEGPEKTSKKRKLGGGSRSITALDQNREIRQKEKDGESDGKEREGDPRTCDKGTAMLEYDISREGADLIDQDPGVKRSKKERKAERKASGAVEVAVSSSSVASLAKGTVVAGEEAAQPRKTKKNNRNREKKRKGNNIDESFEKAEGTLPRFIVFIGNLPFSTTTESIREHFAAVHPKSIRHLTKKNEPQKSRGCAFLEFEGYDHMKTCLKSFHHSIFDDGASAPRKINVELTAGGGGNKKNRHSKIHEKNQKLNDQRIRRRQEEEKVKLGKRDLAIDHSDVHPSRRARVPDIQ